MKIEPGNFVKCIREYIFDDLTENKIYKVYDVRSDYIEIKDDVGCYYRPSPSRFKHISSEELCERIGII